jgi:lipopolysaccharide export system protein LptA
MNKQLFQILTKFSIALLCTTGATGVNALSTDKNQDIEIESDSVYLDDTKNVGIYSGNVVVVQGSIRITGDKLTVFYTDENELEKIIVDGQPATFRQLPDNSSVHDEAEALIMEYHENQSLIILTNKARVKQGDRRLLAEHIEYDTELSQVRAKAGGTANNANEDTRVRLIIPGKKASDDAAE